jgi:two-component system CheB/CheR fusion protein
MSQVFTALGGSDQDRDSAIRGLGNLNARQTRVLDLMLEGRSNKAIAADLGISQRTLDTHRVSILNRTGARSFPALGRFVTRIGSPVSGDDHHG